jgi:hypothetical protein
MNIYTEVDKEYGALPDEVLNLGCGSITTSNQNSML